MRKTPEEYLKEPYSRILLPEEDGGFSAEILEFPGCYAQGDNPSEAFSNLEEAAKSWIKASLDQDLDIPSPALNQSYSGKIALRIPRSLHKRAAQFAERDATSLNQFLISAIAARIGAEEYHSYLYEKIERFVTGTVCNTFVVHGNIQHNPSNYYFNMPILQVATNREELKYVGSRQLCFQP